MWRLLLGIGLVPLFCTLYTRLTMPESKPYEQCMSPHDHQCRTIAEWNLDVAKDTSLTDSNKRGLHEQIQDFREYFGCWKHAKVLFATCMTWFLL